MVRLVCGILAVSLSLAVISSAGGAAHAADAASPAQTEFNTLFQQYKEMLARLKQLQERYRNDPAANKSELQKKFNDKLAETKALNAKLGGVAEKAYLAAPNQNSEVSEFLFVY